MKSTNISKTGSKFGGHEFKKSLGQNFISDTNLLKGICADAGITSNDLCVEIGAGGGTLTNEICKLAKKVVSFEVDTSLKPLLLAVQDENKNLNVVFKDIMKTDLSDLDELFNEPVTEYKVVANLPYYITTPIIFKLFKDSKRLKNITVMVQKEVAERMVAKAGSKDYGVLSCMVQYYGDVKIKRIVKRTNFYPMPKVDSAIVRIDISGNCNSQFTEKYEQVVRLGFQNRRKKLLSNLSALNGVTKEIAMNALTAIGKPENVRAEELSTEEFIWLTKLIYNVN